jgi:hypothetical protein
LFGLLEEMQGRALADLQLVAVLEAVMVVMAAAQIVKRVVVAVAAPAM